MAHNGTQIKDDQSRPIASSGGFRRLGESIGRLAAPILSISRRHVRRSTGGGGRRLPPVLRSSAHCKLPTARCVFLKVAFDVLGERIGLSKVPLSAQQPPGRRLPPVLRTSFRHRRMRPRRTLFFNSPENRFAIFAGASLAPAQIAKHYSFSPASGLV